MYIQSDLDHKLTAVAAVMDYGSIIPHDNCCRGIKPEIWGQLEY